MPTQTLSDLWATPTRCPDTLDVDHETRQRHIRAVALLESGHWTGEQILALEGVCRYTLYQWRRKVLGEYDDPEAVALRRRLGVAEPDAG